MASHSEKANRRLVIRSPHVGEEGDPPLFMRLSRSSAEMRLVAVARPAFPRRQTAYTASSHIDVKCAVCDRPVTLQDDFTSDDGAQRALAGPSTSNGGLVARWPLLGSSLQS